MTRIFIPPNFHGWAYEYNIEANPQNCGLTILHSLEDQHASYSFATMLVLIDDATQKLYMAYDEGCSCPTPFEEFTSLADLTPLRTIEDYRRFVVDNRPYSSYGEAWPKSDIEEGERRIIKHLKERQSP
jgi:hypothetical protein